MKLMIGLAGLLLLLATAGCEIEEAPYGGTYGGYYGEYPYSTYGYGTYYPYPYPYAYSYPYDRDHYWDRRPWHERREYWEHHWH